MFEVRRIYDYAKATLLDAIKVARNPVDEYWVFNTNDEAKAFIESQDDDSYYIEGLELTRPCRCVSESLETKD